MTKILQLHKGYLLYFIFLHHLKVMYLETLNIQVS